ncbi:MAG: type 1 glutamine amidotransferase [Alcanivoracaceae bacterium]|jgi:GMP synthase-like glutamine amidotransferase|nr:type 1 glutamine amidotransferase [Alcanivoracaceae bacterium]
MARVQVLQHVAFEDSGAMEPWLRAHGHQIRTTHLYLGELPPDSDSLDWLIIMGGPMGVHDEKDLAWLAAEKRFIRSCIDSGKTVLGVCLGAQLIADVMGAEVRRNSEVEIGWFPVMAVGTHPLAHIFANSPTVFHWHGDTFAIPADAKHLCRSAACENQAFLLGDKVLGLQFHLETTAQGLSDLCADCNQNPGTGRWIQTPAEMAKDPQRFQSMQPIMAAVLTYLHDTLA